MSISLAIFFYEWMKIYGRVYWFLFVIFKCSRSSSEKWFIGGLLRYINLEDLKSRKFIKFSSAWKIISIYFNGCDFELYECVSEQLSTFVLVNCFEFIFAQLIEILKIRGPIRSKWKEISDELTQRISEKLLNVKTVKVKSVKMRFPYMKILVWVLTFVGYCYSGYGSSVLTSLRDAVLTAEIIFGDVFKNLITVSKKFKTVHEIFDSAVEENCGYQCPGSKKAKLQLCVCE